MIERFQISQLLSFSGPRFVLIFSLIYTLLFNGAVYAFLNSNLELLSFSGTAIAASIFILVFILNVFFLSVLLLVFRLLVKPFLVITALINAAALYYLVTYQVVLDRSMIGNILNTRNSELTELLTPTLFIYVVLLGLLPSYLVVKSKIQTINWLGVIAQFCTLLIACAIFLYVNASSWLWIDKNASVLGGKILPWSYIINTGRYYSGLAKTRKPQKLLADGTFSSQDKMVVVLVIGETARANNFSLYGYPKETNPLLKKTDLLVFNKTTACSTYTTASVACILSHNGQGNNYEPLPSYLARMGADVIWRTNNWGEPNIQVTEYQKSTELRVDCQGEGCSYDEVLLTNLKQRIEASAKDKIFVVLHTKGSHGASYSTRYPANFSKFTPACENVEISRCSEQELINAYDNTILYTDYFLHKTIAELEQLNHTPTMLVYVSDHGESLGEQGLFLHGTPFMLAPAFQKEVPMLVWRSKELVALQGRDNAAVNQAGVFSHANVFHTVLGAFQLKTPVYDPNLDLLN